MPHLLLSTHSNNPQAPSRAWLVFRAIRPCPCPAGPARRPDRILLQHPGSQPPCHHIAAAWLSAPSPKDNGDPRGEILQCQPFPGILPCSKLLDQLLGTAADVPGHLLVLCCPLSLVASLPCLTDHCGFSPGFQQEAKVTALETKQKGHKSSKEIGK